MKTGILNKNIVVFGLLMALVVSFCLVLCANNAVAFADSVVVTDREVESNNTMETANIIALNTKVTGALSMNNDVDWYKFTTTEPGYFHVAFTHPIYNAGSVFWRISIYDSTGVNNVDGETDSYFTNAGNKLSYSPTYGVGADTFYIKVSRAAIHSNRSYEVTVNFTAASDWESENNNSMETADVIQVNKPVHGSLTWANDEDWYKFSITDIGYFNVSFDHTPLAYNNYYWRIYLYDENGVNGVDGPSSKYDVAGDRNLVTCNYGVSTGTYYIRIVSSLYSANDYTLTVNFTTTSDWETEYNNSMELADELSLNQVIYGSLSAHYDEDWYKITIPTSCEIAVVFNYNSLTDSNVFWKYCLYDYTGKNEILLLGKTGLTESLISEYISLSAGTYYVRVANDNPPYLAYSLCITQRHEHVGSWVTSVDPTCTLEGVLSKRCTVCAFTETQDTEPLGHDYDAGVHTKEATIVKKGEILYTCLRCGEELTKQDASKLWVLPVISVAVVLVPIGIFNYIRAAKKKK